eukprot:scaffold1233_cov395-Prasinococcus_capsulatus_cf.AAC.20
MDHVDVGVGPRGVGPRLSCSPPLGQSCQEGVIRIARDSRAPRRSSSTGPTLTPKGPSGLHVLGSWRLHVGRHRGYMCHPAGGSRRNVGEGASHVSGRPVALRPSGVGGRLSQFAGGFGIAAGTSAAGGRSTETPSRWVLAGERGAERRGGRRQGPSAAAG